jgi:hypothetical protein
MKPFLSRNMLEFVFHQARHPFERRGHCREENADEKAV